MRLVGNVRAEAQVTRAISCPNTRIRKRNVVMQNVFAAARNSTSSVSVSYVRITRSESRTARIRSSTSTMDARGDEEENIRAQWFDARVRVLQEQYE